MERRTNPYAPQIIHNFLQDAQNDGAITRYRLSTSRIVARSGHDNIAQQLNSVAINIGTHLSETEMAEMQDIKRQAVNSIIDAGLLGIWEKSTLELKIKYPLSSLCARRVKKIDPERAKTPQAQEAISLLNENQSREEIAKTTNLTAIQIRRIETASRKLKKLQQKETFRRIRDTKKTITIIIEKSQDRELVQKALDILPVEQAKKLAGKENSSLISFFKLLKYESPKTAEIYDFLKETHIPVLRIHHGKEKAGHELVGYFIVKRYAREAVRHLRKSALKDVAKSKVRQISGPRSLSVPTVSEFSRPKKHKKVGSLIPAITTFNMMGVSFYDLCRQCPVPIFMYPTKRANLFIFATDRQQEVEEYLKRRLEELGIKQPPLK